MRDLLLNNDHIHVVEQQMREAIKTGLKKDTHKDASVKCFPTYVRYTLIQKPKKKSKNNKSGPYYAILETFKWYFLIPCSNGKITLAQKQAKNTFMLIQSSFKIFLHPLNFL